VFAEFLSGVEGEERHVARPRFPVPIFPPPPNFVFRFAKCAAKIESVSLVPPAHMRATISNSQ